MAWAFVLVAALATLAVAGVVMSIRFLFELFAKGPNDDV